MTTPPAAAGFIRTVRGDVPAAELGVCYAHEHVVIDESYATRKFPDFLLADTGRIAQELQAFHAAGGRAMIDSMPCAAGRNAHKLAEVSRRSGVHLVAPTGAHLGIYYPPEHWTRTAAPEQLAELWTADIEQGIDRYDYSGPLVERTAHRAGVIKVASGSGGPSGREVELFEVAAAVHRKTGCPILTHTEQGTGALEQIELFRRCRADLAHIVLSHTDRRPDPGYHREILSTGVRLEYDSAFRWKEKEKEKKHAGNPTLDLVVRFSEEFPGQILLGMDAARPAYWKAFGGAPGLDFLLTDFTRQLRAAGLGDAAWQRIFIANPAQAFSFATPSNSL